MEDAGMKTAGLPTQCVSLVDIKAI